MVAKHDAAQSSLMAQLKARRVRKTYLSLVHGNAHCRQSDRSRPRSDATRSTGRGWRSSPTAVRRRPATGSASGSPAGRSSSSTS